MFIRKVVGSLYKFLTFPNASMSDSETLPALRKARSAALQLISQSDQSAHEESGDDVVRCILIYQSFSDDPCQFFCRFFFLQNV